MRKVLIVIFAIVMTPVVIIVDGFDLAYYWGEDIFKKKE